MRMNALYCLPFCLVLLATSCNQTLESQPVDRNAESVETSTGMEASPLDRVDDESTSLAVFEQRILPIFQSSEPSSCAECHLSGVDLKSYIRPTQTETFTSLVAAELIDVENPDESKILQFIDRRPDEPGLVTDRIRRLEYEAFLAWILAAVENPELIASQDDAAPIGPTTDVSVIRHARSDRVLASFVENVWTEVGRCAACHSPDRNQQQVEDFGEQVSWIVLSDPQATLNYMLDADLINIDEPEESLLLLKPTLQVDHEGGEKMVVGDRTYKQFRRFIDDYAAIKQGTYVSAGNIPMPNDELSLVTDIWFKIEGVPAKYDKMLLQADLYRWSDSAWTDYRVASSDRAVFGPANLWQHSLSLTAPRESQWAKDMESERLPAGRYLVKIYVDQSEKLGRDLNSMLGPDDLVGQVEFESRWPVGYGNMTVVRFPND